MRIALFARVHCTSLIGFLLAASEEVTRISAIDHSLNRTTVCHYLWDRASMLFGDRSRRHVTRPCSIYALRRDVGLTYARI
jgi:hypothetical protein